MNKENKKENSKETNKEVFRSRKKVKMPISRKIIIAVLSIVIVFCAYKIISILVVYNSGDNKAEEIASINGDAVDEDVIDGEGNDVVLPIKEINYEKLKSINSDFVAWIQGPNTAIDYPVVQGYDNDYYLNVQFDYTEHEFGALFLDYQNNKKFTDNISIIYGHHMKNGSMFASIIKYRDQEYYEDHKYLILYTENQNYLLEPYASTTIDGSNTIQLNFSSKEKYQSYIDSMISRSDFKSDITMTSDSNTVILYTCAYEYDSARYILLCRLTPIN